MTSGDRLSRLLEAHDSGQPALTIELALLYLSDHPDDRTALLVLGEALTDVAQFEEAREVLERALEQSGLEDRVAPLRLLGRLYDDQQAIAEAEDFYRQAIAAAPAHASAYVYLGAMLARIGRLEEAQSMHERATQCMDGARDEAFFNLGLVQRARRDYLGALHSFRQAIELDPDYSAAREALDDVESVLFRFPPT